MKYLRIDVSGDVELSDGHALSDQLDRPEYNRGLVLSVIQKGTKYSPEVRKYFRTISDKCRHLAAVVTSPILRAAVNMMFRLVPQENAMRMFADEASAIAWLEQFYAQYEAQ